MISIDNICFSAFMSLISVVLIYLILKVIVLKTDILRLT